MAINLLGELFVQMKLDSKQYHEELQKEKLASEQAVKEIEKSQIASAKRVAAAKKTALDRAVDQGES